MWKTLLSGAFSLVTSAGTSIYIYLAIAVGGFGAGFYVEHLRFAEFATEVEMAGKAADARNKAIEQQHALVTKEITNDYQTKLTAIRNFYASGVHNPSSGAMSGISAAPRGTDAETAYPILAGQCAETTQQLVSIQDWINQQAGIK
jgi:hypothetical protein